MAINVRANNKMDSKRQLISGLLLVALSFTTSCGGSGGSGGLPTTGGSDGSDGSGIQNESAIVYVRYPNVDTRFPVDSREYKFVTIPQGEVPYKIAPGADLVLLNPDGKEEIIVDCTTCSVMDPYISYDGSTVYYSLIENAHSSRPASWIYKVNLEIKPYKKVRLTFPNDFDSLQYGANMVSSQSLGSYANIRDMAPVPLADGRLLITSNRAALIPFHPGTNALDKTVQLMYVMDDHDGSAITPDLANMEMLETGSMHMVQHPMQLKDGRILFSSWQDVATKYEYAMTNLMTVHPDGSNLQQFTEPHDHHKNVEHFVSQLTSEEVVSALYYPSFDFGFGVISRYPLNPSGLDFLRGPIDQVLSWGERASFREFDRKNSTVITTHTTPSDVPAPGNSGKYSMPSAARGNSLLVAYSTGSVNFFNPACQPDKCEALKSGIYLIPDASGNSFVDDPSQLILIKDEPEFNEIWPRSLVSYQQIYGQERPDILDSIKLSGPQDDRLIVAEAKALVGTSSMYNRESLNEVGSFKDRFQSPKQRELHDGNWTIQGTDAGVFDNIDIYGVRIVASPSIPFTEPLNNPSNNKNLSINRHLLDSRLQQVPAR